MGRATALPPNRREDSPEVAEVAAAAVAPATKSCSRTYTLGLSLRLLPSRSVGFTMAAAMASRLDLILRTRMRTLICLSTHRVLHIMMHRHTGDVIPEDTTQVDSIVAPKAVLRAVVTTDT
jgi:hypothetical protein